MPKVGVDQCIVGNGFSLGGRDRPLRFGRARLHL